MATFTTLTKERKEEVLAQFVANPDMVSAVKQELLKALYQGILNEDGSEHDPESNFAVSIVYASDAEGTKLTNEELGERLRASAEAIRFMKFGFQGIEDNYKPDALAKKAQGDKPQHR